MLVDYILNLFRQYPPNQVVTKEYYRMKSDMDLRLIEDMTKTELKKLKELDAFLKEILNEKCPRVLLDMGF